MSVLQEIRVPLLAVNDTSLTVVEIPLAQGDFVHKGEIVLVLETSKTTYDVISESDGYINYLCVQGEDYEVNDLVAKIVSNTGEIVSPVSNAGPLHHVPGNTPVTAVHWEGETLFSEAAMELIASSGIGKTGFAGFDFVSREDVEKLLGSPNKIAPRSSPAPVTSQSTLLPVDPGKVMVEKLSSYKKKEMAFLGVVQSGGLTSTINTFVETAGIFVHINESLKYLKNSLLPVIIYEAGRLLEKFAPLNAYFTGDGIAFYKQVDIGFAIDIDKGLKVLKVSSPSRKSIGEIEGEVLALSNKYMDDTLEYDDLTGISFTITDLSAENVAFFKPLVNSMNSAILGISSIDEKLNRCMLSLTFDHRVTEGKLVARFLNELKSRLESYQSKLQQTTNQEISCFKCGKKLEDDLSDTGFSRCITPKGTDAYICQSCFKGF